MAWPDADAAALIPRPGSIPFEDPRNDAWRGLLPAAIALIEAAGVVRFADLTAGGGSMLAARYGHRESRDLDLFLADPQLLAALSPRLTGGTPGIAESYEEASNFLKFTIDAREIDFVAAAPVLGRPPSGALDLGSGRRIAIEPPGETLAKKLLYRAAAFLHRDAFDLAVVASLEPAELYGVAAQVGPRALDQVAVRLDALGPDFSAAAQARILPRPGFTTLIAECHGIAVRTVADMRARAGAR